MTNIYGNGVVNYELSRLESLIDSDDSRDVQSDIDTLKNALEIIETKILNANEKFVVVYTNMWEQCQDSFYRILDEFNLVVDADECDFDNHEIVVKRWI